LKIKQENERELLLYTKKKILKTVKCDLLSRRFEKTWRTGGDAACSYVYARREIPSRGRRRTERLFSPNVAAGGSRR